MSFVRLAWGGLLILVASQVPISAQVRDTRRCVSITDVNARIDCLEGITSPGADVVQPPNAPPVNQAVVAPSFDCRFAGNSIERAICADPTLSEWDARMGQLYQQVLKMQKGTSGQSLLEGQRAWVQQRNSRCGAVADSAFFNCLLAATKDRLDTLSQLAVVNNDAMAQILPPVPAPQNSAMPVAQSAGVQQPIKTDSTSNNGSNGSNPLLVLLFLVGALYGAVKIIGNIRRKERLARERAALVAKYGDLIADRILDHDIWKGMTEEQDAYKANGIS
jgi:uncharacterized protein